MNENRKRMVIAGVVIGAVAVGLVVLSRRVPRDKWGSTLGRIAKDALGLVKARYGDNPAFRLAEQAIDRAATPQDAGEYA